MTYEEILSLLPSELLVEGNANNIKKVLSIYSKISGVGDILNDGYGAVLDIYCALGQQLDFIGAMFSVFRLEGELDNNYRTRILADIIKKRTPTTLPDIQGAIDSIVSSGKLYIMENYINDEHVHGVPCNVYLTGTADEQSISTTIEVLKNILPAGVFILVPIVSFDTWGNIYNQFSLWQSLLDEGYIW